MSIQQPTWLGRLVAELLCAATMSIPAQTFFDPPPARADCETTCEDGSATGQADARADAGLAGSASTGSASTGSASTGSAALGSASTGSSTVVPNLVGMGLSLILPITGMAPKTLARTIVPHDQFASFDQVISHESAWNVGAMNPKSGAYGLGQALPPEKMASYGRDWPYNPATQIRWAYSYMCERYGNADGAWAFWQIHHWY